MAEQGFYGCVFCVNARFTDQGSRVNPAITFINESDGFYHFWKEVSDGRAGKCCSLVVWDGKYRKKAARMMEGDGAALMSCWRDDGGKSEGGRRLVKEAKDGKKELCGHVETDDGRGAKECMERQTEKFDFWKRALESKNCFWFLMNIA